MHDLEKTEQSPEPELSFVDIIPEINDIYEEMADSKRLMGDKGQGVLRQLEQELEELQTARERMLDEADEQGFLEPAKQVLAQLEVRFRAGEFLPVKEKREIQEKLKKEDAKLPYKYQGVIGAYFTRRLFALGRLKKRVEPTPLSAGQMEQKDQFGPQTKLKSELVIGEEQRSVEVKVADILDVVGLFLSDDENLQEGVESAIRYLKSGQESAGNFADNCCYVAYSAGMEALRDERFDIATGLMEFAYQNSYSSIASELSIPQSVRSGSDGAEINIIVNSKLLYAEMMIYNAYKHIQKLISDGSSGLVDANNWNDKNQLALARAFDLINRHLVEQNDRLAARGDEATLEEKALVENTLTYAQLAARLLVKQYDVASAA